VSASVANGSSRAPCRQVQVICETMIVGVKKHLYLEGSF
jgi:hypothetical protein